MTQVFCETVAAELTYHKKQKRNRRATLERKAVHRSPSGLPLWGRRLLLLGLLLLFGGGVVQLQRLPDLPVLLVHQLQSQRAV